MAGVGVFSGTFDPVHEGHIAFCLAAIEQAGLTRVVLLPERSPRGKQDVTNFDARAAMLRLAVRDHPDLGILELEQPQFTVAQTLPALKARLGDDLVLLVGSDLVRTFSYRWPGLSTLLKEATLIIALRHGDTQEEIELLLAGFGQEVRFQIIRSPKLHAASSGVRAGERHFVHPNVQAYISLNGLYNS